MAKLLDRAQPDPIGFAQGPVDGPRLRHTHLGTADKWRHIRWVSIAEADESSRTRSFVNGCFEHPAVGDGVGYIRLKGGLDTAASLALSDVKQAGVRYIPATLQ